ncbi:MAG: hypothetical protein AAGM38_16235 [Pseudomonadota bacterium]
MRDGAVGWAAAPLQALVGLVGSDLTLHPLWRDLMLILMIEALASLWVERALSGFAAARRAVIVNLAVIILTVIVVGCLANASESVTAGLIAAAAPIVIACFASEFMDSTRHYSRSMSARDRILSEVMFALIAGGFAAGLCAVIWAALGAGSSLPIILAVASSYLLLGLMYLELGGVVVEAVVEEGAAEEGAADEAVADAAAFGAISRAYGGLMLALFMALFAAVAAGAALGALGRLAV